MIKFISRFRERVLEDVKRVPDVVQEGGMIEAGVAPKGRKGNKQKKDKGSCDTSSRSGAGEMSGLEGLNEMKREDEQGMKVTREGTHENGSSRTWTNRLCCRVVKSAVGTKASLRSLEQWRKRSGGKWFRKYVSNSPRQNQRIRRFTTANNS